MDVRLALASEVRVDDGLTDRQLALRLDVDMEVVRRDHARVDEGCDGQRVVDGCSIRPLHRLGRVVALDPALGERRGGVTGRRAQRPERGTVVERDEGLMGRVERHERDPTDAAVDDDARGLRIRPDVELGAGRDVPVAIRAAHDHELRDQVLEARLGEERGRDVRERPDGNEDDLLGRRPVRLDEEFDGAGRLLRGPRWWDVEVAAMHSVGALDVAARDREVITLHGLGDPLVDRYRDADMVEDA